MFGFCSPFPFHLSFFYSLFTIHPSRFFFYAFIHHSRFTFHILLSGAVVASALLYEPAASLPIFRAFLVTISLHRGIIESVLSEIGHFIK